MIIANGYEYYKDGIIYFTGWEEIPCPECGGKLHVRGTCGRKLRRKNNSVKVYRLRVMECGKCGKTHRELPGNIIPYRRMDLESVSELAQISHAGNLNDSEASVWRRVKAWVFWFLDYAGKLSGHPDAINERFTHKICEHLKDFVKFTVNAGKWIQHRSALRMS